MKELNLLKSLILVMTVLLSTGKAFCEATAVQQVQTVVQPTVAVEKTAIKISGDINPSLGGEATTLSSSFSLKSNDEKTFFVVYSRIQVEGDQEASAFDENGDLLFANTSRLPKLSDVNNAKTGVSSNANVIVYPFNISGENVETIYTSSENYKECYKVTLENQLLTGTLNQTVGGSPVPNTYSTRDEKGLYSATVYVTAVTEL